MKDELKATVHGRLKQHNTTHTPSHMCIREQPGGILVGIPVWVKECYFKLGSKSMQLVVGTCKDNKLAVRWWVHNQVGTKQAHSHIHGFDLGGMCVGSMTTGLGWSLVVDTHCHKNAQGKHPQLGQEVHMTTCKELREWPPCVPNNYQPLELHKPLWDMLLVYQLYFT